MPKRIIGLAKGGIIPAALLLQEFPDAEFGTLRTKHYGQEGKLAAVTLEEPDPLWNAPETLIVDDICDSGDTFAALQKLLPKATYAAMLWRINNEHFPLDYHGSPISPGWVDFPWEPRSEEVDVPF